jgi:hypothetical protein
VDVATQITHAMDKAQDNISSGDTIRIVFGIATVAIAVFIAWSQVRKHQKDRVMLLGLYIKARQYLPTAAAVIMVLAGAYLGRAARRSMEIKAEREDNKRLQHTGCEK